MQSCFDARRARVVCVLIVVFVAGALAAASARAAGAGSDGAQRLPARVVGVGDEPLALGVGFARAHGSRRVRALQRRLAGLGQRPGLIDGRFGARTLAAVVEFQRSQGLRGDGIVGARTLARLRVPAVVRWPAGWSAGAVWRGSGYRQRGGSLRVREVQRELRRAGYSPGPVDGLYGPRTERAVRRFEAARRLEASSVIDARTLGLLRRAALASGAVEGAPQGSPHGSEPGAAAPATTSPRLVEAIAIAAAVAIGLVLFVARLLLGELTATRSGRTRAGWPRPRARAERHEPAASEPDHRAVSLAASEPDRDLDASAESVRDAGSGFAAAFGHGARQRDVRQVARGRARDHQTAALGFRLDAAPSRVLNDAIQDGDVAASSRVVKAPAKPRPVSVHADAAPARVALVAGRDDGAGAVARAASDRSAASRVGLVANDPPAKRPHYRGDGPAPSPEQGGERPRRPALPRPVPNRSWPAVDTPRAPDPAAVVALATLASAAPAAPPGVSESPPDVRARERTPKQRAGGHVTSATAAIGYMRVNRSDPQDKPGAQAAEAITALCDERRLALVRIARDVERRADACARPALRWVLDQLVAGRAQTLVVARLADLSDNAATLAELLRWLDEHGQTLIAVDLGIDTSTESGRLAVSTLVRVGAWERERISARTRRGLQAAHSRGASARPRVADVPELRDRIRRMRADGMTLQAIADALNADGIPTLRGGAKWRPSSVQAATGYRRPSSSATRLNLPPARRT